MLWDHLIQDQAKNSVNMVDLKCMYGSFFVWLDPWAHLLATKFLESG